MKTYRLVTLFAALLITVFLVRFFTDEKVGDPQDQAPATAAAAP